jgi:hypothetical protein
VSGSDLSSSSDIPAPGSRLFTFSPAAVSEADTQARRRRRCEGKGRPSSHSTRTSTTRRADLVRRRVDACCGPEIQLTRRTTRARAGRWLSGTRRACPPQPCSTLCFSSSNSASVSTPLSLSSPRVFSCASVRQWSHPAAGREAQPGAEGRARPGLLAAGLAATDPGRPSAAAGGAERGRAPNWQPLLSRPS